MFSLDSRKKLVDLEKYIRRLADVTGPARSSIEGDSDGAPETGEAATALTKDVSDHGVGVVLHQRFRAQRVAVCLWLSEEKRPWFFLGEVRKNSSIGGGYWVIGVELTEMLKIAKVPQLGRMMSRVQKRLPVKRQCRPSDLLNR